MGPAQHNHVAGCDGADTHTRGRLTQALTVITQVIQLNTPNEALSTLSELLGACHVPEARHGPECSFESTSVPAFALGASWCLHSHQWLPDHGLWQLL